MKFFKIIFVAFVLVIITSSVFYFGQKTNNEVKKPIVSVSTYALYDALTHIGGDEIEVFKIIPLGSDAHTYEPTPDDIIKISKSKLFIYNGGGFEPWVESLEGSINTDIKVVDMGKFVTLYKEEHHEHEHGEDDHHHHEGYDPHYWLDMDNMIKLSQKMVELLSEILPQKRELFKANGDKYIAQLEALKKDYDKALARCDKRVLITNHNAFGYLARAYGIENHSVIGLSSDEQPSAKVMSEISKLIKEKGVKTIFFEELINDNVSHTLAKEVGIEALALQPLENITKDEFDQNKTFISIMRENLAKLSKAMECH